VEAVFDYTKDKDDELTFTTGAMVKKNMMAGLKECVMGRLDCSQATTWKWCLKGTWLNRLFCSTDFE